MKSLVRVGEYGLIAVGILALGYCAVEYRDGVVFQATENRKFQQELVRRQHLRRHSPSRVRFWDGSKFRGWRFL